MDPNNTFPQEIVREITSRGAVPTPRWRFFVSRGMLWLLAVISVLVGGVAFAVAEFVFLDNDGISKLQSSSILDIAQSIPFLWLAILAFFSAGAYYSFRHTRRGYKYATLHVVTVVIVLSLALGLVLNIFDFGQYIHQLLTNPYVPQSAAVPAEGAN
jgi:uncharacterized membrane protein YidH (DUF202 family)